MGKTKKKIIQKIHKLVAPRMRFTLLTIDIIVKRYYNQETNTFKPINIFIHQQSDPNLHPPEHEEFWIEQMIRLNKTKKTPTKFHINNYKRNKSNKSNKSKNIHLPPLVKDPSVFFESVFIPDGTIELYKNSKKKKKYKNWFRDYYKDKSKLNIIQPGSSYFITGSLKFSATDQFEKEGLSVCISVPEYPKKKYIIANNCGNSSLCYVPYLH